MKKTMGRLSIGFFFICCFSYVHGQAVTEAPSKSVALILKINGDKGLVTSMQVFESSTYNGVAKNLNRRKPTKGSDFLKIRVDDDAGGNIFEGYFENPLNQNLESFEEDGTINNNTISNTSGFINVRFPIQAATHDITIHCYTAKNNEKETEVATLKFSIK